MCAIFTVIKLKGAISTSSNKITLIISWGSLAYMTLVYKTLFLLFISKFYSLKTKKIQILLKKKKKIKKNVATWKTKNPFLEMNVFGEYNMLLLYKYHVFFIVFYSILLLSK
jgi:hypothetical protein